MMKKIDFNACKRVAPVAVALFVLTGGLWAATTDTQTFTLTIPSVLSIAAPTGSVSANHDESDADQVFAAQTWAVNQNQILGAAATFSVSAPFVHATAPTIKRDCKLTLAIASSDALAVWTLATATDQTDYAATIPDIAAAVTAASLAAGNATLNLTVTFVDSDFGTLAQGSYSVTVTGTVAANL